MIVEQIRKRLEGGFRPFTLHLSDGRKFPVLQRDFIAVSSRVVVIIDDNDVSHTINPAHIVSIEEEAFTPGEIG